MLPEPMHVLVLADLEQQVEVLGEQRVVVLESQPEQRERLDERSAAYDHFGPTLRQKIERRETLKQSHGIDRAEDCYGARETDSLRACGRGREDDWRRGIEEV